MTKQRSEMLKESIIKNKKKLLTIFLVAVLVSSFVFLGFTLIKNTSDINRLEVQSQEVKAQYEAEQSENDELLEILENNDMDSYIEQKAREKGYAKSDEVVFYDISAGE
ncbi:MAG: septum formation initiator family protein [Eubacterium sp.]|nr:septum formation initiator family protein [Eubacterium sp.]